MFNLMPIVGGKLMVYNGELSGHAVLFAAPPLNRRELWMSVFLASMLMAAAGLMAVLSMYTSPGEPLIDIGSLADFPPSTQPYRVDVGQFRVYVVNTSQQLVVLDALAPYNTYRIPIRWIPFNQRFENPVGGSKFTLTGDYIEGPALRSKDRYSYEVAPDGTIRNSDVADHPG